MVNFRLILGYFAIHQASLTNVLTAEMFVECSLQHFGTADAPFFSINCDTNKQVENGITIRGILK
jgi:hypothetical protein